MCTEINPDPTPEGGSYNNNGFMEFKIRNSAMKCKIKCSCNSIEEKSPGNPSSADEPWPADPTAGKPDPESIRAMMRDAWADHHHTRDQSWKTVKFAAALFAGMLTLNWTDPGLNSEQIIIVGICVCMVSIAGACITWHHGKVEYEKRMTILWCEQALGVLQFVPEGRRKPLEGKRRGRTAKFIILTHLVLCVWAAIYVMKSI